MNSLSSPPRFARRRYATIHPKPSAPPLQHRALAYTTPRDAVSDGSPAYLHMGPLLMVVCSSAWSQTSRFEDQMAYRSSLLPWRWILLHVSSPGPAPQSSTQPCSLDGRVWAHRGYRHRRPRRLRRQIEQGGDRSQETQPTGVGFTFAGTNAANRASQICWETSLSHCGISTTQRLLCVRDLMVCAPSTSPHRRPPLLQQYTRPSCVSHREFLQLWIQAL